MKRKELTNMKEMSLTELGKKLKTLEENLARFVKSRYTTQSKNIREGKLLRADIARIRTIMRVKELSV